MPARVVFRICRCRQAFVGREETGMVNAVLDPLARQLRADEFGGAGMIRRAAALAEDSPDRPPFPAARYRPRRASV